MGKEYLENNNCYVEIRRCWQTWFSKGNFILIFLFNRKADSILFHMKNKTTEKGEW